MRTSQLLVHEAHHHLITGSLVEQELAARDFQIDYYLELRQGTLAPGGILYQAPYNLLYLEDQRGHRLRNQLVDHIISRGYGSHRAVDPIDAQWVRNHLTDWGGLGNRWPNTRRVYLDILLGARDNLNEILDILESEQSTVDFRVIMMLLGERLRRIFRSVALDSPAARRIERLELRHHIDFGILQH